MVFETLQYLGFVFVATAFRRKTFLSELAQVKIKSCMLHVHITIGFNFLM